MLPSPDCATLGELLVKRRSHLFVVEASAGGAVQAHLSAVTGASRWFLGGVVCYADAVKTGLLALPTAVLADHGAVSEPAVRGLAEQALALSTADWVLVESGVYGPGGGSPEKPVGRVCLYVASRSGVRQLQVLNLQGDRASLRSQVCAQAIAALHSALHTA